MAANKDAVGMETWFECKAEQDPSYAAAKRRLVARGRRRAIASDFIRLCRSVRNGLAAPRPKATFGSREQVTSLPVKLQPYGYREWRLVKAKLRLCKRIITRPTAAGRYRLLGEFSKGEASFLPGTPTTADNAAWSVSPTRATSVTGPSLLLCSSEMAFRSGSFVGKT